MSSNHCECWFCEGKAGADGQPKFAYPSGPASVKVSKCVVARPPLPGTDRSRLRSVSAMSSSL